MSFSQYYFKESNELPELILPIGISGSGKSTWINEINKDNKYLIVSPDEIRKELTGDISDQSMNKQVFHMAEEAVQRALKEGQSVIYDATNVDTKLRREFLKTLPECIVKAKFFPVDPEESKRRIKKDVDAGKDRAKVPDDVVDKMHQKYQQTVVDIKDENIEIVEGEQMRFKDFYEANEPARDWRDRYVWHTTRTGRRNRVLIRSLSPEEQDRYRPKNIKRGQRNVAVPKRDEKPEKRVLSFYYGVTDEDNIMPFEEGQLIEATIESRDAMEFADEGKKVVVVHFVPMDAIKQYQDEEGEWHNIDPEFSETKKYEFVKFEPYSFFKLDLFPYKDTIEASLDEPEPVEDEGE